MPGLEGVDEVAYRPPEGAMAATNAYAFMREYGIDDYDELIERTTTDVGPDQAWSGSGPSCPST